MPTSALYMLLIPSLAACDIFHVAPPPADVLIAVTVKTPSTTTALVPTPSIPATTSISVGNQENLELKLKHRQAPDAAPIVNPVPNTAPIVNPVPNPAPIVNPVPNPAVSLAAPIPAIPTRPMIQTLVTPAPTSPQRITVIWVETWIGTTSQTWIPTTVTIKFDVAQTKAPEPGEGVIGMGTLTGQVGKTKTVVLEAAATRGVEWSKGAVVAAGVGFLGMLGF